jgi:probable phosphoglycerate mutase
VAQQLWLIRHGETEWSRSGAHTGKTDLPLTEAGCANALAVGRYLAGRRFALVLISPRQRARETSRLAGFGAAAVVDPDLAEWDYGAYEGRTTDEIRAERPGWSIWNDGPLEGETLVQVAARARRVIERATGVTGDVALFAHGHILRVLAACRVGLPPDGGRVLALDAGSVSVLGWERETPVISRWNLSASERTG